MKLLDTKVYQINLLNSLEKDLQKEQEKKEAEEMNKKIKKSGKVCSMTIISVK